MQKSFSANNDGQRTLSSDDEKRQKIRHKRGFKISRLIKAFVCKRRKNERNARHLPGVAQHNKSCF